VVAHRLQGAAPERGRARLHARAAVRRLGGELKAGITGRTEDLRPPPNDPRWRKKNAQLLRQAWTATCARAGKLDALIATGCDAGPRKCAACPSRRRALFELIDLRTRWLAGRVTKPIDLPDGGKLTRFRAGRDQGRDAGAQESRRA